MQTFRLRWKVVAILLITGSFIISPGLGQSAESFLKKKSFRKPSHVIKSLTGLYGEPQNLADLWFQKQGDFISLTYTPGKLIKLIKLGTLEGKLKNGQTISIEIQEGFYNENSGMIPEHLRALKHRAEVMSLGKEGRVLGPPKELGNWDKIVNWVKEKESL